MKNLLIALLMACSSAFGVTQNKVWRVPNGGTLPSWGAVNLASTNAVAGLLGRANLSNWNYAVGASTGTHTASSTSFSNVNVGATITTNGGPVLVMLINDTSGDEGLLDAIDSSGTLATGGVQLRRGTSGSLAMYSPYISIGGAAGVHTRSPCTSISAIDSPSAGTYTYNLYSAKNAGATASFNVYRCRVMAIELK